MTHSCDSYVVREMIRRSPMRRIDIHKVYGALQGCKVTDNTEIVSVVEVTNMLNGKDTYTDNQAGKLAQVLETILDTPEHPLVTIHDAFKTYPQYGNYVRRNYAEILAEISESNLMESILQDITGTTKTYHKAKGHEELPSLIRASNYGIC